ncbi:uncharacterized protein KY384_007284 [Bacidia gigantensis]|uniref:uncharacterized protein n=1 Tax=Bacidia gigantensis TaxID=2732470 RepID=UPI001D03CE52|nr:uncharacterized protein KY384_007284 [Bacidia gigantensis]KAG8528366.1 hypothetical protein KY384_007284 [Bacidia gigantensis]
MNKLYDVIVAGGGPIGLFLACELRIAGVSVRVLERDANPESEWKVMPLGLRGLNTPSIEGFYRRGLLDKIYNPSERAVSFQKKPGFQFGGHFAGISLNANKFDLDRWKYRIDGPSLQPGPTTIQKIEKALIQRAEALGVEIGRGNGVTSFVEHDDSLTVHAGENQSFRTKWLVGCDGGHSVVRKQAGFDFIGTEPKFTGYAIKCDWDHFEKLKPGFHPTKNGMYILGGPNALYMTDFDNGAFDRSQEITKEHVQSLFERISGITDVKITKVHLASNFTDRCMQTTQYRKGRVILAGDAAHIHGPVGAQGLNLGLGDAMNLGWKLAATIRQEAKSGRANADLALLDTYESERHPIGVWVLDWVRAQVNVLSPDPHGQAAQSLIRDLIGTTEGANLLIERFWGLTQRYELVEGKEDTHPLVGSSAPDFELIDGSRLGPKLERGRGMLVDFGEDSTLKELLFDGSYEGNVEYVELGVKDTGGLRSLLIRPDGIVAWVTGENAEADMDAAKAALRRWFGH